MIARRQVVASALALAGSAPVMGELLKGKAMFGLIGSMSAKPGQRNALVALLLDSVSSMPGCLSYVVAHDAEQPDVIWITEVWDSADSHKASLSLPAVRAAIAKAMPIIGGMGESHTTTPVGGHGLVPSRR